MDTNTTSRCFATLRIIGKTLNPKEVTASLQLKPSETRNLGDLRGKSGQWPHGYWELSSKEHVNSPDLASHLEWLLTEIEPSSDQLQMFQKRGFTMDIFCFWESLSPQGGINLNPGVLQRIATLNLELGIDIYFDSQQAL